MIISPPSMIKPEIQADDAERVAALEAYGITNTLPEPEYNNIAKLASIICNAKVALVTFIDGDMQWFKAYEGTDIDKNTRELALCSHAINSPDKVTYVPDTREDERFRENPMITGPTQIQFYAGVPLVSHDGHALGTVCVMDHQPRELTDQQLDALSRLSQQVLQLLELRRKNFILKQHEKELEEKNKELENFAAAVSHDIKSPLNNIGAIIKLLNDQHSEDLNPEVKQYLDYMGKSSLKVNNIVEGMLAYYKNTQIERTKHTVNIKESILDITNLVDDNLEVIFDLPTQPEDIKINKVALELILSNLITNAAKYNDKDTTILTFGFKETDEHYEFSVQDNGPGIEKEDLKKIFKHYTNLGKKDRDENLGTGLGLALVKKILKDLNGKIDVNSTPGKGSTFSFSIPK